MNKVWHNPYAKLFLGESFPFPFGFVLLFNKKAITTVQGIFREAGMMLC
jgi:hypothetical protein